MFGVGRFYAVVEKQLYAGPMPCSLEPEEFPVFKEVLAGAPMTIVNLLEPHEMDSRLLWAYDEVSRIGVHGVEIVHYPMVDHRAPASEHMRAVLDRIDYRLAMGKIVYVHCWSGVGRTATVIGCWLRRHGTEDAIQRIYDLRHGTRDPHRASPRQACQIEMIKSWPKEE
jgi:protein-tyrosine phosphatase